jgi:hypothetical protein
MANRQTKLQAPMPDVNAHHLQKVGKISPAHVQKLEEAKIAATRAHEDGQRMLKRQEAVKKAMMTPVTGKKR